MPPDNPYRQLADGYASLLKAGANLPLGGIQAPPRPTSEGARSTLIFAPHPDDECIIGGLPLRLIRESGMQVTNVAVTLGNHRERQMERWRELEGACAYLGFGLLSTADRGLEEITIQAREVKPDRWSTSVAVIAGILKAEQPDAIFLPHDQDWHPAHIGTHQLVLDALSTMPASFTCHVIETEFWQAMTAPNLMIESRADDVADLMAALSFHVGEVKRNAYHLRLPAWMIDNVRRGAELVQGRGATAPDMAFATLYRLKHWRHGGLENALSDGKILTAADDPGTLIA